MKAHVLQLLPCNVANCSAGSGSGWQRNSDSIVTNWKAVSTKLCLWYWEVCTASPRIELLSFLSCLDVSGMVMLNAITKYGLCLWSYISLCRTHIWMFALLCKKTCSFASTKLSLFLLGWCMQNVPLKLFSRYAQSCVRWSTHYRWSSCKNI